MPWGSPDPKKNKMSRSPCCGGQQGVFFGRDWYWVYECGDCGRLFCDRCTRGGKCPSCGSSKKYKYGFVDYK